MKHHSRTLRIAVAFCLVAANAVGAPMITDHAPRGLVKSPVDAIEVTFSEPIDPATFTADDITLTDFRGISVSIGTPVLVEGTTWRCPFPSQSRDFWYTLTVGPHVANASGEELDQNQNEIGGEDTDRYTGRFGLSVAPEQTVLCINVHGSSYDSSGQSLYQTLVNHGVDATFINLSAHGQVTSELAAKEYDQVWVFDLSSSADGYTGDWQAIADWYNAKPDGSLICDARIISSYWSGRWQGEGQILTANYYENMKLAGGGLMLGTDHNAFHRGINSIPPLIGVNPFVGSFNLSRIPVDVQSVLMTFPNDLGDSLYDDSSPGQTPYGLQPNGRILYTVAWHSGNVNTPGISTTISPLGAGINCFAEIVRPEPDSRFRTDRPLTFEARSEECGESVVYTWRSDLDGPLGEGEILEVDSLSPGYHTVTVLAEGDTGGADEATVSLAVEYPFVRGDMSGDGVRELGDALMLLGCLFQRAECPTCRDAADSNDDGYLEVSDAIYLLDFLYLGASPPPIPTDACGLDPTLDELDCELFEICPEE